MRIGRARAVFGVVDTRRAVPVVARADAMHHGMAGDPATYASPPLALPDFKTLITLVTTAQTAVGTRVIGASSTRDVHLRTLIGAMETERLFVQGLADANSSHAVQLIQNAGLLVARSPVRTKLLLELRKGPHPGSLACDANVALLVAEAEPQHPYASKWFGWQYTIDGGLSFVAAPDTGTGKTLLSGLPVLTEIGVRVNVTIGGVTTRWSDAATIVLLS